MRRHEPPEDTGRVLGLAIAFFGALALLGWAAGVFERVGPATTAAVAAFAALFAAGIYALDPRVRAWVGARLKRRARRVRPAVRVRVVRKAAAKSPGGKPAAT